MCTSGPKAPPPPQGLPPPPAPGTPGQSVAVFDDGTGANKGAATDLANVKNLFFTLPPGAYAPSTSPYITPKATGQSAVNRRIGRTTGTIYGSRGSRFK